MRTTWQFFDDREAWLIFRLAAFGEAIGWTLLITGIAYKHFGLPNGPDVLTVLGQTHGTLFFGYAAAVLAVASSLRWSKLEFLVAAAVSVPPYGTLVYEKFLAHRRKQIAAKAHRELVVRACIRHGSSVLLVQPKRGTFWCLPGGQVQPAEQPEQALQRLLRDQLGIKTKSNKLLFTHDYMHHGQPRLELFYDVTGLKNSKNIVLTAAGKREYDEIAVVNPSTVDDLRPEVAKDYLIG